ncbi:MAG: flagellar biosynthetic protein FliO [Syntrophaceae bacterium]|nr:flagellar biosynthetic protein FliO [Syntrophaceae bacterium]
MEISLIASFLKMIFALAVVLGLLVGVMYFMKIFMQQTGPACDNQALINVISSKYLGPKNRIILVEVLDQVLVVGICNQQMTTLATIEDHSAIAKIKTHMINSRIVDFPKSKLAKYISQLSLSLNKHKDKAGK